MLFALEYQESDDCTYFIPSVIFINSIDEETLYITLCDRIENLLKDYSIDNKNPAIPDLYLNFKCSLTNTEKNIPIRDFVTIEKKKYKVHVHGITTAKEYIKSQTFELGETNE